MKAIRIHQFGGPEVLKLEELPLPKPGQGEVLVRVKAIGVNPVDSYIRAGIYGPRPFPFVPGIDAAGVVEAVGSGVKAKAGDRVYVQGAINGTYAEVALCRESQIHPLPESLSFAQGAAIGVAYVTAYFALVHRAKAVAGESVLIHGASGGVGVAALQIARVLKLRAIGTAGSEKGLTLVKEQGTPYALNHRSSTYLEELLKITDDKGVDIIVEMLANENLGKDLKVLAPKGRVIVVGSRGTVTIDPRDTMARNADIRGMSMMSASDSELVEAHEAIGKGLAGGVLRPVVGKEIPLAQAASAHEEVMKSGAYGKIVLLP